MFEKIASPRHNRPQWLQPWTVQASLAAHAVLAAGVAAVPLSARPTPQTVEEVAGFFMIPQPVEAPEPSPAAPAARDESPPKTRGADAAEPKGEAEPLPRVLDPVLSAPEGVADALPDIVPALALAEPTGIGEGGTPEAGSALTYLSREGGGAPVVAVEVLAEQPRLINRRMIGSLLGRLYPNGLAARGVQGQVVAVFVIGTDGRVEMRSVRVVSASHPGFVEPTLRGIARMRFHPARLRGEPVRVRATIPVDWALPEA